MGARRGERIGARSPQENHKEFLRVGRGGLFSSDEKSFSPIGFFFLLGDLGLPPPRHHQISAMHALANDPLFCPL